MNKTEIEWCDYTWNPITGCSRGCSYCYAARDYKRWPWNHCQCFPNDKFKNRKRGRITKEMFDRFHPFSQPHFHPERFEKMNKKPGRVFVCSTAELFDPKMGTSEKGEIWQAMQQHNQHTYILLTKKPEQAKLIARENWYKHIWLGVTVTNNDDRWRIEELMKIPAAVRFVSVEPMLGPLDIEYWLSSSLEEHHLNWVIVGAQTGPGAVKPTVTAAGNVVSQCREAGVPLFIKDNLEWSRKIQEWPEID